tara:strand:+ start:504 stop:1220 length:717 start_codon:yes stop_codon:yes gene_type:complete
MATTIAQISLDSSDLLSSALQLSSTSSLTTAGSAAGISLTSGLGRKTTSAATAAAIQATVLYRADDALTNGGNKVYLKNASASVAQYFTVLIDQEEMGRLYGGDWAFFPWCARSGTKALFTVTIAATWAVGDTWTFDGITLTASSTSTAAICLQIDALNYPNWTTTHVSGESTVIFTARYSSDASEVVYATADGTLDTAGNGTANISGSAAGVASESDITIRPSVHTAMTLEHMLFHE